jgi:hypothetical protein
MDPNITLISFISWNILLNKVCERLVNPRNLPSVNRAKFTFSEGLSSLRVQLRGLQTVAGMILLLKALRADKWSSGLGGLSEFTGSRMVYVDGFRLRYALMEHLLPSAHPVCYKYIVHASNVQLLVLYISRTLWYSSDVMDWI